METEMNYGNVIRCSSTNSKLAINNFETTLYLPQTTLTCWVQISHFENYILISKTCLFQSKMETIESN